MHSYSNKKVYSNTDSRKLTVKYQINSMIDDDMDPIPIMHHIEDYKIGLFEFTK